MKLPSASELDAGHIVGMHFPTSAAKWPHCALIVRKLVGSERASVLAKRRIQDRPDAGLFMAIMISHGTPRRDEMAERLDMSKFAGTTLDATRPLYICYSHFDISFLPGDEKFITGAGGNYMGNVGIEVARYYFSQFMKVNAYLKQGGQRPPGILKG